MIIRPIVFRHFITLILMVLPATLLAQDIIYLKDESKIKSQVTLIDDDKIYYKKAENLEGPEYTIDVDKVIMITYENGTHDVFDKKSHEDIFSKNFGRHLISNQLTDLLIGNFTLSYEYFFRNGLLGLRAPASVGYSENRYIGLFRTYSSGVTISRVFMTGLDLNYYPTGQGQIKYFIGPSISVSQIWFITEDYIYNGTTSQYVEYKDLANRIAFIIQNGLMYQASRTVTFAGKFGLGTAYYTNLPEDFTEQKDNFLPAYHLSFSVGYRFGPYE